MNIARMPVTIAESENSITPSSSSAKLTSLSPFTAGGCAPRKPTCRKYSVPGCGLFGASGRYHEALRFLNRPAFTSSAKAASTC